MSREILFKARETETEEWRYGYLIPLPNMNPEHRPLHIFDDRTQDWYKIDQSTVCQYTGLKDKADKMIFENDIVKIDRLPDCYGWIRFGSYFDGKGMADTNYGWYIDFLPDNGYYRQDFGHWIKGLTVVGNYYDNPELLKYADEDTVNHADQDVLMPAT